MHQNILPEQQIQSYLNNPASAGDVVDITGFSQANSAVISSGGSGGSFSAGKTLAINSLGVN